MANRLKNIFCVLFDATAATQHSQSPIFKAVSRCVFVVLHLNTFLGSGTFSVIMPCIKWNPICILNSRVEIALHVINGLRYKIQTQFSVSKEIV